MTSFASERRRRRRPVPWIGLGASGRRVDLDARGTAALTTAALSLIVFAVAARVAMSTTPIADDYTFVTVIPGSDAVSFLHGYWAGLTDRYSDAVLMLATVSAFGSAALQVTPMLLLALMCWFFARIANDCGVAQHGRAIPAAVGILLSAALVVTAPSVFDTLGWYTAVAIYLAGVVAGVGVAARAVSLTTSSTSGRRGQILISFLTGAVASGFTELIGIEIVMAALLATLHAARATERGPRRRSLLWNLPAIAAGGATGVAVIFLGPGSQARAEHSHAMLGIASLVQAVNNNWVWLYDTIGWRLLPAAGAGLVLWQLTRTPINPRTIRWMLIWSVFLFVVPLIIVAVATGYSGAPLASYRAVFVATASMGVGTAILAYALAAMTASAGRRSSIATSLAAIVAVGVGVVGFVITATPVIAAEHLRAHTVAIRAASIHQQLRGHPGAISVTPAPLIDPATGAFDLIFGGRFQFDYVVGGIRIYYRIPAAVKLRIVSTQPGGYCLAGVDAPFGGIRACGQLAGRRRPPSRTSAR